MIKRTVAALAVVLVASIASAQSPVTQFQWTPGPIDDTHDAPTETRIKCGRAAGGPYTVVKAVPVTSITLGVPQPTSELIANVLGTQAGTWFCVATAANATGESGASNEVTFRRPGAPSTPALRVQ